MQVQKKEIRDKILEVATQRFYTDGYMNTTTRQIATDVEMSVSNLYKYFRNKEEIFDVIVSGYYNSYVENFARFISHESKDTFDSKAAQILANALFESIRGHQLLFVLLMDKSNGTKYGVFKNEIITQLEQHIVKGVSNTMSNAYFIKVVVRNFFNGIIEIAREYQSDEWTLNNLILLAEYHLKGISILY